MDGSTLEKVVCKNNTQNFVTWWRYAAKKIFFNFEKPPYDIIDRCGQWAFSIAFSMKWVYSQLLEEPSS